MIVFPRSHLWIEKRSLENGTNVRWEYIAVPAAFAPRLRWNNVSDRQKRPRRICLAANRPQRGEENEGLMRAVRRVHAYDLHGPRGMGTLPRSYTQCMYISVFTRSCICVRAYSRSAELYARLRFVREAHMHFYIWKKMQKRVRAHWNVAFHETRSFRPLGTASRTHVLAEKKVYGATDTFLEGVRLKIARSRLMKVRWDVTSDIYLTHF